MTDLLDRPSPEPTPGSESGPEPDLETAPEEIELDPTPPVEPAERGRDGDGFVEKVLTAVMVAAAVVFTVSRLHPGLLLEDTTPAGGDFGAHVWGPAYLRDHLLPWRLSGWAPDWYAGFPMYRFYMVVPALVVVVLDLFVPYGVALKLVSILGIATLPIAAWALGRLGGTHFPIPGLMAVVTVVFLFDETFTIYGGNIASTMAGEFSFSIALSLGLVYLGLLAHGLRTGRHPVTTAVVLALSALCHGIVAMAFLTVGSVVIFLAYADWRRWKRSTTYALVTGGIGALLTAFWMIPFLLGHAYMTDMAYERREDYWEMLFPQPLWIDRVLFIVAVVGLIGSVLRRRRLGIALGAMVAIYMVWVPLQPQGMLWNARLLPFLYLCRYFLVVIGFVEMGLLVGRYIGLETQAAADRRAARWTERWGLPMVGASSTRRVERATWVARVATAVGGTLLVLLLVGMQQQILPGGREVQRTVTVDGAAETRYGYQWGPLGYTWGDEKPGFVDNWAEWNYRGYENKSAYGEYYGVVTTMQQLGEERGCGRALWENNNDLDKYGTPMALMLLPFWTDGCIDSMEGLFFEASGTTPYHFLTAAALSESSSNPVRRLRYEDADVAKGVEEAKLLGVRYYLAFSPSVVEQADANPDLTPVATTGPWHVYEIEGAGQLVTPLEYEPVVVEGADDSRDDWLTLGTSFFQDPDNYDVMPAADGPSSWQRVGTEVVEPTPAGSTTLPVVGLSPEPERRPLPQVAVSDIQESEQGLSFTVDRVGVPVLVKVSYFPNWKASGADGPYRVAPNLMLVVPTEQEVSLHFGRSGTDWAAWLLTLLGVALALVVWRRQPWTRQPAPARVETAHDEGRSPRPLDLDTIDGLTPPDPAPGPGREPASLPPPAAPEASP